jgi:hypothetical protein
LLGVKALKDRNLRSGYPPISTVKSSSRTSPLISPKPVFWIVSGLPLALIGNASGQTFAWRGISIRGVFDKEVRRKPLAFAADAWSYGI